MMPNDLGKKCVVEDCQRLDIAQFLRDCRRDLKAAVLNVSIEAAGVKIDLATSATGYGGARFWFKCPWCDKRVGTIFRHPYDGSVGCRTCLRLMYRQQRYKGMIEEIISSN